MVSASSPAGLPLRRFPAWLPGALLVALLFLAYGGSLSAPFLFDDLGAVVTNPTIRRLDSAAIFRPPTDGSTTTGRPFVNASYALNYAVSGESVGTYHAFNLLIHALSALLLMGLFRLTAERCAGITAGTLPFWAALLWALHPLQTETVVTIAQRTEGLCGLCYLATLYAFARAGNGGPRWLLASAAACLVGMGTKEVMVTAPFVVLLYDRTFVAGTFRSAWAERRSYYLGLGSTWLLLAGLLLSSHGARGASAGFGLGVSSWRYLLQQCEALPLYLERSVWPFPLVLDYGTALAADLRSVWIPALAVIALLLGTLALLRRNPPVGFALAWFFLILAPSSSFVPLVTQTMAEHRMYLPLAALIGLGVAGLKAGLGRATGPALAFLALALGAVTIARVRDYADPRTLWETNVRAYPESARAHNNLALVLQSRGLTKAANREYAEALARDPGYVSAHYNLGVALLDEGKPAEAAAQFETVVRLAPTHADAYLNLGNARLREDRLPEALTAYEQARQLQPGPEVDYDLGMALEAAGRPEEAARQYHAALAADPALAPAQFRLGRLAESNGDRVAAEAAYTAAIRLAPKDPETHRRLGLLLAREENFAAAAEQFRELVRLQPTDADARANLGNALLLAGDARAALASYEAALTLRPDDPRLQESIRQARAALP